MGMIWGAVFSLGLQFLFIAGETTRPPQFVVLAFDNCKENSMWQDTLDFCQRLEDRGIHVRFTYFLSAVTLLTDEKRTQYKGPNHAPGKSEIDFGEGAKK